MDLYSQFTEIQFDDIFQKMLIKQNCIIRIYLLDAFGLTPHDYPQQDQDPYVKIKCGNSVINEREKAKPAGTDVAFYTHYDIEQSFPGCSSLTIELWDKDFSFGDDLIGSTSVDLEQRYFSQDWNSDEKPIEYRQLYHPSSMVSQGVLRCWIEILTHD